MTRPHVSNNNRAIATTGTFLEKMQESLRFAETNRNRAMSRRQFIADVEQSAATRRHEYSKHTPLTKPQLDVIVDTAVGRDGTFKLAVSNEQWGARLATLYGVMELVASTNETNTLLRAILVELRTQRTNAKNLESND